MTQNFYSVFDIKAEMYSRPFIASGSVEASRMFARLVEDKETMPGRYPNDFKLVCLGSFDDVKGQVNGFDPITVCFASEFVKEAKS